MNSIRISWILVMALLSACSNSDLLTDKAGEQGPPLTADPVLLAQSLVCSGDLSSRSPVLLVHGTAESADGNFAWNYVPALQALDWPVCTVQLPNNGIDDIQDSAEYIVYAIRELHRLSGHKLQIAGHSQGGMIPRWALKYWPDTRAMVDDLVGFASSNHGTLLAVATCEAQMECPASFWQQTTGSLFITALNDGGETFPQISYTAIYTHYDEVVIPNLDDSGSTSLQGGGANVVNVATQDVCPTNMAEHLGIGTFDAVAYALAMDAFTNDGPADPARMALTVCAEPFMPGVNPMSFATDFATGVQIIGETINASAKLPQEPPLKCYVTDSC